MFGVVVTGKCILLAINSFQVQVLLVALCFFLFYPSSAIPNYYSVLRHWQGMSTLTVGAQQVGWKCMVNKVKLRFNAVNILIGQHFIINTWLLNISKYQTQLSIINNHHKIKQLEPIIINMWLNHLRKSLKHTAWTKSITIYFHLQLQLSCEGLDRS
jgi:hypothetical protein